jgi:type I restriction-modification system DNA methylase subunit
MLDQLPQDVWTNKTTTFFDPAIAGGQFVREIERRLLETGHSKKNVANRVFGCEEYEHQVQYALNKHKLLGNYTVTNFLEQDFNMKFDVIVGNPPYQSGNGESGGKHSLWRKFVKKS